MKPGLIKNCRSCESLDPKQFFNLGLHPPSNSLLNDLNESEKKYPLALMFCDNCNLVQLSYTVDPRELFSHYVWVTGTSPTTRRYAERFFDEFKKRTSKTDQTYILEIASNDGTFLAPFLKNNYKVLGIDPAENITEVANQKGIPTRALFWGSEIAENILKEKGASTFVFARNVLPHVADTRDFVAGLACILHDNGILAIEVHYSKIILDQLHYDSIYHEHLCYFTLKSLERLLNAFGLYVFDLMESPISGGSIVVYTKKMQAEESEKVKYYREIELKEKINEFSTWENFRKRSEKHREDLLHILREVKKSGGNVIGWGASARSSTLLNFDGIAADILPAIIDLNPMKQGKFTAGTHIQIVSAEDGMKRNPTHIFLSAWNFTDEIIGMLKTKFNFKGKYIVPLPNDPKVID